MKLRMVLSAFFNLNNICVLILSVSAAGFIDRFVFGTKTLSGNVALIPIAGCAFIYLVCVGQTLFSKKFHEDFNRKEKIRQIHDLNYSCLKLSREAKKHVSSTYFKKLSKVMEDKNEIVKSFFRGEYSYVKEKIVEQTLNLVVVYIKLLMNFCIRSRELCETDLSIIGDRINANIRKLDFTKDVQIAYDLKNLIEMDKKIIKQMKEEKHELEKIRPKLDYMESTVNMFKHQIISNIESEEMLGKIETAVNEASALDSVLEVRRRNRADSLR